MELSEGHNDAWRKLRSTINPRKHSECQTLTTTDEHNNITRHTTIEQKLNVFADHSDLRYKLLNLNLPPLLTRWISNFLKDRAVLAYSKGTTSRDVTINHAVPQGSPLSSLLYLVYTHDLPPTSKVFRPIFADDQKYFVAGPNLYIITKKLQQSMDDLAVYANQCGIGLNAGKTLKLFFQRSTRSIPDWHITQLGKAIRSVTSATFLGITFS